jgi:hypothetical protein
MNTTAIPFPDSPSPIIPHTVMLSKTAILVAACMLLGAASCLSQFEIKGAASNLLDPRRAGASAEVQSGSVSSITVRGGGSGYVSAPNVIIAPPPSGSTATALAVVSAGRVVAVNITNGGSGYATPPAVFIAPAQTPSGPAATTPQFAGVASTAATAGPISTAGLTNGRYPQAQDMTIPGAPVVTAVLTRASFGYTFASGVPLYFMGDEIQRPRVGWDGSQVAQTYWRPRPVIPGETFDGVMLDNLDVPGQPVIPLPMVNVLQSSTGNSQVTVQSLPAGLMPGATILGRRVNMIQGLTLTLAGNANQTISASTPVSFTPYQPFYYSPHANRVFASQPGRVTILWVSALPDTSKPGETTPTYKFRSETFAVSSASQQPARTIYWTEKGFNGPLVSIPEGRIVRVNPVYNSFVPPMAQEYQPVGSVPNPAPGASPPPEPRTLWFENQLGPAALHAYNVEGRVMIEYLGIEQQGGSGLHQFLGADIVDIKRVAEVTTIETHLGETLRPRQEPPLAEDAPLIPRILFSLTQGQKQPYGSHIRPDGVTDYYAERENLDADRVSVYWMEPNDAAIHFPANPGATPGLSVAWPKYKRNYRFIWPESLAHYEPVNVLQTGAGPAVGPRFAATSLPQIAFQDDPAESEAEIDPFTQRLLVDFSQSSDRTNRSLLKFNSSAGPWYVRLFIQSENALGSPEKILPNGTVVPAVYTINDRDGDGEPDLVYQATVGKRIEPPPGGYALAGYVSRGRCHAENLYQDPFASGVEEAASGAIIPVNALEGDRSLTVWWFRKVTPPNNKFEPFHLPAVAARYHVSYPEDAQELVIASGKGVENPGLTSAQAQGSIYYQNDPSKIGYNPNEEHALLLAGNAYALRDDLNTPTSSQPYVLIQYMEAATTTAPARPAMRVLRVVRETETYPLSYLAIAGTPSQPPMPLTVLPLPLLQDGKTVRNYEVEEAVDPPAAAGAPGHYDGFTFVDRKGQHWTYRGPHDDGEPTFGMRFFYLLREGFHFPALSVQPTLGSIQPFIANVGGGESVTLTYRPVWPDDEGLPVAMRKQVPEMQLGQTLTMAASGLPQVRGQSSAQLHYQQSLALHGANNPAVVLHDPTRARIALLDGPGIALPGVPPTVPTSDYAGKTYFQKLPPHLQQRFYYQSTLGSTGGLVLVGEFVDEPAGEDYLHLNWLSAEDEALLKGLCPPTDLVNKPKWNQAIESLRTTLQTFRESTTVPGTYVPMPALDQVVGRNQRSDVSDPDTAVDSYALSSTGAGMGYVTLVFGNGEAFTDSGEPVQMQIIRVVEDMYQGDLKVLLASNPLDEQVMLRHSGDYGGEPANFEFEWRYGFSQAGMSPSLANVSSDPAWIDPRPNGSLGSSILIGGSPDAVLSTPAVLMGDTWFTMRYRKAGGGAWSEWLRPALVEGWVKRVLARITPFNQRMENLYNMALNTDVSLLTQAGGRWEGDIALNLSNVNEAGLIEVYETILNRARSFTVGSGIDFGPSNDALILAAGYLHDLYTILGHEAYADAANPTISIDDQDTVTEVNTSRFSFEGQVGSSLEEELALLRGRDDFGMPSVAVAPAYNRLWWNYTRGIDSGEVLYAVNYNIREKAGSPTANGTLNAADAQRMFPQGHGDAYGHYLTALKGYYKLLTHPYFTWIPRAEAVNVLGQAVLVDYKDERKFASAAANLARTSREILGLVHRQSYREDSQGGWAHLRDGKTNTRTGVARHQGFDETASRSAQGAFYHWVVANATLPDVDRNPEHSGVQIIDRTTVPELSQLVAASESFQSTMDLANARLNPLGLSPGAIAFDISPAAHQAGHSHYEQIYDRAMRSLLNAKGSFDQAAKMTRLLRNQENQIGRQQEAIEDEESAYNNQLIEIYGTPYAGDIGPGKTYAQGYSGPDIYRWFIINRPTNLVDTRKPVTVSLRVPVNVRDYGKNWHDLIKLDHLLPDTEQRSFQIQPDRFAQFADIIGPGTALGQRFQTGALQDALMEAQIALAALLEANQQLQSKQILFDRKGYLYRQLVQSHVDAINRHRNDSITISTMQAAASVLANAGVSMQWAAEAARDAAEAAAEALPTSIGTSTDATAPARGAMKFAGFGVGSGFMLGAISAYAASSILEGAITGVDYQMERALMRIGFDQAELQSAYEFEEMYRELLQEHHRFNQLLVSLQQANERVRNLSAQGQALLLDRESFRQRAAAVITGYRTKDLTFRSFRNEALEQYRTLFDLASRYSYLAAKSYDYETGLLGSPQGRAVIQRIVAARSLGDLTGDIPQATTSTLGDAGLAGNLAQMNADFSVAKGRLGINNPDPYGTLFSLRRELFRILDASVSPESDASWRQALEQMIVPDLLGDADVTRYCNNIQRPGGGRVPGLIIPFSTTIEHGRNFFGLPLAAGDHAYTPSSFATKISSAGIVFQGYAGMDPYAPGSVVASNPNGLSATPYVYLIPCGDDFMLAPPLGGSSVVRRWTVHDQALPLPYNLGASAFNTTQFFSASGSLSEQPWILRKHQAFRPVHDPSFFYSSVPAEFTNRRLIARSVWNSQWKIVIPAYTLLHDEQEGLNRFVASVKDIQLFLRTYSHSGN